MRFGARYSSRALVAPEPTQLGEHLDLEAVVLLRAHLGVVAQPVVNGPEQASLDKLDHEVAVGLATHVLAGGLEELVRDEVGGLLGKARVSVVAGGSKDKWRVLLKDLCAGEVALSRPHGCGARVVLVQRAHTLDGRQKLVTGLLENVVHRVVVAVERGAGNAAGRADLRDGDLRDRLCLHGVHDRLLDGLSHCRCVRHGHPPSSNC